jgi:hypothetical protein
MACDSIEATFQALAEEWRRDTSHLSWTSMRVQHPAYLKIIAMGSDVLPLLLRELQEGHCPSDWLWALRAITGAIGPRSRKKTWAACDGSQMRGYDGSTSAAYAARSPRCCPRRRGRRRSDHGQRVRGRARARMG